jgi:hypothetical protein
MTWQFTIDDETRAELVKLMRVAPAGWRVAVAEDVHTDLQRMKFNAMCGDLSRQIEWDGEQLSATEWKHWLTAAWKQQRMVRGLEPGTIVFVGEGLKKRAKADLIDLIELAYWFGTQQGVVWSEKAKHQPTVTPSTEPQEEGNNDEED